MTDPAALRRRYARSNLTEDEVGDTWLDPFRRWFGEAADDPAVVEANAMSLATADAHGHPAVRVVLVKAVDERGLVFYTNYGSAKASDLDDNPHAAAVFAWLAHERQVRFAGPVRKVSREETEAYFASRPRESQLGAWASPQSRVVTGRDELEAALAEVTERFADRPVPAPPNWGGYRIEPLSVEFWQGRPGRLHDRIRFRRDAVDSEWRRERLAP